MVRIRELGIPASLAGVAMWLITKNNPEECKIGDDHLLIESMGIEGLSGDMNFKVADIKTERAVM